jgi:hypothetical protein
MIEVKAFGIPFEKWNGHTFAHNVKHLQTISHLEACP